MPDTVAVFQEYWRQRNLIPKGAWLLLAAYILVAFGSPMPPQITWLEVLMGGGLLLGGILQSGSMLAAIRRGRQARWVVVLAFTLLFIPLMRGTYLGNSLGNQVRDVIPLLFLISVPLLLILPTSPANRIYQAHMVTAALLFVGSIAAIIFYSGVFELYGNPGNLQERMSGAFLQHAQDAITPGAIIPDEINPDALAVTLLKLYDPAILFTGIFISAMGVVLMAKSWERVLPGMILLACGAAIAYGFMIVGLRAYTALFALAVLGACVTQVKNRGFYVRVIPLAIFGLIALWPQISAIAQLLLAKQQMMGSNGKGAEWLAVISTVTASPQTLLFGVGWGGTFENPILTEATRFTHSAISFYLLKAGLTGLAVLLLIIWMLPGSLDKAEKWGNLDTTRIILLVSCIPPLLIGVMFQPVYKMLSYGFILALFVLLFPELKKRQE